MSADMVWIVWDYDGDCPYIASVHNTEADARAEAAILAEADYARAKADHDAQEAARVANIGSWQWSYPSNGLAPVWIPANPPPEPVPFAGTLAHYERRVEAQIVGRVSAETLDIWNERLRPVGQVVRQEPDGTFTVHDVDPASLR